MVFFISNPHAHLYNIFFQKVIWFKNHLKLSNINDKNQILNSQTIGFIGLCQVIYLLILVKFSEPDWFFS